jgi:hypothetical protein
MDVYTILCGITNMMAERRVGTVDENGDFC